LKTSEQIAEENNTSPKSVQRAETYAKAVDTLSDIHGEEVKEKILSGEIRAYKQDVVKLADCEPEKQAAILQKVKSGESKDIKSALNECALQEAKETAISVSESDSVDISIHHGDCVEWLSSLDRCADLLITDPPYATDVEDIETFAQSWLPIALSKVKPSGRAYVCIGAYPGELKAYLNVDPGELELCQVLVWTYRNTLGPSPNDQYKQNWQAILYYKGLEAPQLNCPIMTEQFSVQDINAPDNRHGKYERWHAWQKPDALAERLIRHSTEEGDLVIDPFAGTGTFLIAAKKLNRDAIGCDKSQDMIQIAYSRGGVLNNEL
jgi:site-specific DNA-methyltransferase (adenine-specific)